MTDFRDQLQASLGGAYSLERELGGGGMSRVFVARDEALGRAVVVKVLAPELAEGVSIERFAREIRLAAALQEPHIVPLLSAGATHEGLPYYTMPFVAGESLRARLRRGADVPIAEAVSILRDVTRALVYAHSQGIVHRDIKPDNILLSSGTAMVTDFGIAKAIQLSKGVAPDGPPGPSLGSPAYMAPEQATGESDVDHRADLYSLGVLAYELLAGHHPFPDKTSPQQLLGAHLSLTPPPLAKAAPHVPRRLAALVTRCLDKDAEARPHDAEELRVALDDIAAELRTGRRVSRWVAVGAAAAAAVVTAALTVAAWRASASRAAGPPLVAVLPFESEGAAVDSTFADGLGDAVAGKLARLSGLRVIDRTSVAAVRDAAASPARAGKLLGATYVLRASLRWARDADGRVRVRVTPLLVRVADGTTRWAGDPLVVSPADPFAAQASIAEHVADALDVALGTTERARLERPSTRDTGAYAAVERGQRIWGQSTERPEVALAQALREFERAYALDPQYADAYGLAAGALQQMARGGARSPALFDSAAVLARRALALDPGQRQAVEALTTAEMVYDRPARAMEIMERAVRESPSNVELLSLLGHTRQLAGDSAAAWNAVTHAVQLGPRSYNVLTNAFDVALALRRYDDARSLLARRRALDPTDLGTIRASAWLALSVGDSAGVARALHEFRAQGGVIRTGGMLSLLRRADATLVRELARSSPDTYGASSAEDSLAFYSEKAQVIVALGDSAHARALVDSGYRIARRLASDRASDPERQRDWARQIAWFAAVRGDRAVALDALRRGAVSPRIAQQPGSTIDAEQTCLSAGVYALLGDPEAMFPVLRRCVTMPNGMHRAELSDPVFSPYRADPRMQALVRGR
jgi:serine/threonine-protein kinase